MDMSAFVLLLFVPLVIFALIASLNALTFPRLKRTSLTRHNPRLSVLIPMRNEAAVIAQTVRSLLAQDYPNLEILLLDDGSEDGSAEIARDAAAHAPHLKVFSGQPLPPGWLGKTWACHQLSEQAGGDYLLFTDADVRWEAGALTALISEAQRTRADLLVAWPTQIAQTWSERLVVPLMAFSILAYLPVLSVHHLPWPIFSAAIGQCLLFKRTAYQQVGGHAAIPDHILDDMAFAHAIKRHRLRLRMVDANHLIQTRMYHNWQQVRNGFAKNILAGHGNSVPLLLLSTLFHWWLFIFPWCGLIIGVLTGQAAWLFACLAAILLAILIRALTAAVSHQRLLDAVFMPVSVFLMTIIALQAIYWHFTGRREWKGRILTNKG